MLTSLELCIALGVATASASMTLTKTPVFNFVRERLNQDRIWFYLWGCPYCMAHWVTGGLILLYHPQPFGLGLLDLVPAWLFTTTIAAVIVQVMLLMGKIIGSFEKE